MRFRGSASSREVVESMTDIEFMGIVQSIHGELVESLEWATATGCPEQCAKELPQLIQKICQVRGSDLSLGLQSAVADAVLAESIGLGPLEPLLSDPQITDILVNSFDEVFVEREGKLSRANIQFVDNAHVMRIIQRIAARVGRRLDEGSPVVDARMEDGSRVHAVVPPLAVRGPTISIRRFSSSPLLLDQLVRGHSLDSKMASFLAAVVTSRVSCLISGGTGAGKTTLLNALSACIPSDERIVTIEDVTELRLVHPHIVSLEARNSNVDGRGEISIRELVRNSLRMRPDRIIVGEVRGNEAIDMLQALNTGHEGSMTTIHANDTGDALARLELLVGMAGYDFSLPVLRKYIATGVKLLIHVGRQKGGVRRILRISELIAVEDNEYRLMDIFRFQQTGLDENGRVMGEFHATGYLPECLVRIRDAGVTLPESIFAVSS